MKIRLLSLTFVNFKRIRNYSVSFDEIETDVFADNGIGKTTLADGYFWLLFGKDSTDRKDFEIKTLDENNEPYHKLDHEVEGVFEINGDRVKLRRCYREKWEKPKGKLEAIFTGHVQEFFWNDVPMILRDYNAAVSNIINESIFKLVSNTNYFNAQPWQDRRGILLSIAGEIPDRDVIATITTKDNKSQVDMIINAFSQKKTIEQYKLEVKARKKKIQDELIVIPTRIQEANRAMPEEKDYETIESNIVKVNEDIQNVEDLLSNKGLAAIGHQNTINNLTTKRQDLQRLMLGIQSDLLTGLQGKMQTRKNAIATERSNLTGKENDKRICLNDYNAAVTRQTALNSEKSNLQAQWETVNALELKFKEGEFCCPACKREFEAADIESKKTQLTQNFNVDKSRQLGELSTKMESVNAELKDLEVKLSNLFAKGTNLKSEIATITERIQQLEEENTRLTNDEAGELEKELAAHSQYQLYHNDVKSITEQIDAPYTPEDTSALKSRKVELSTQLQTLNTELATKQTRLQQQARINELQQQESTLTQDLADQEAIEHAILQFEKAKMDVLENRINGRFEIVKFKLFDRNIDGGEIPACITLKDGVPFSDLNTAGKVQAGLDIINTLSAHYGIQAPVWVDCRESVVTLPKTECQLINLIVSAPDKKLRVVKRNQLAEATA